MATNEGRIVIVRLTGGLGNQLFQYCFGRSLAKYRNAALLFDTSHMQYSPDIEYFNVELEKAKKKDLDFVVQHEKNYASSLAYRWRARAKRRTRRIVVYERGLDYNPQVFNSVAKRQYYVGHWQSMSYWKSLDVDLVRDLRVKSDDSLPCEMPDNSVAVHVRLGDFIQSSFHRCLDVDYYANAIQAIKERVDKPRFSLFSNDYNKAREALKHLDIAWEPHVGRRSTVEDFVYMKSHKNFIIANSTFSWWASLLSVASEKVTVAPDIWYQRCSSEHIHRIDMTLI